MLVLTDLLATARLEIKVLPSTKPHRRSTHCGGVVSGICGSAIGFGGSVQGVRSREGVEGICAGRVCKGWGLGESVLVLTDLLATARLEIKVPPSTPHPKP